MISRKYIVIVAIIFFVGIGTFILKSKQSPYNLIDFEIQQLEVERTISASGIVKSENQAELAFAASGKISYLGVENGAQVSKGKLLAQIYAFSQNQSSQSTKDARDIALRNKDAYVESNKNASNEFHNSDEYKIQIRKYDELISQAEASYQSSIGSLDNLKIRAPFAGTILNLTKDVGEIAGAGEKIYEIADLSKTYFEIAVDQEDFGQIKLDQPVHITLDAYPDEIFSGKIYGLPQSAETGTDNNGSFIVKIKIEDTSNPLPVLIGMTGDVNVVVEKTEGIVNVLPFDAIYRNENSQYYVWTLAGGKIHRKNIEIGVEGNLYTEIIGLDSSDQVVSPTDLKVELIDGKPGKIAN